MLLWVFTIFRCRNLDKIYIYPIQYINISYHRMFAILYLLICIFLYRNPIPCVRPKIKPQHLIPPTPHPHPNIQFNYCTNWIYLISPINFIIQYQILEGGGCCTQQIYYSLVSLSQESHHHTNMPLLSSNLRPPEAPAA